MPIAIGNSLISTLRIGNSSVVSSLLGSAGNWPLIPSTFSPQDLFVGGFQGYWNNVSISDLWQDAAGTTPVTEAGQSIRRWRVNTASGSVFLTHTDGTTPPVFKIDANGAPCISNPGLGTGLRLTITGFTAPAEVYWRGNSSGNSGAGVVGFGIQYNTVARRFGTLAAPSWQARFPVSSGTLAITISAAGTFTDHTTYGARCNPSLVEATKNNVVVASAVPGEALGSGEGGVVETGIYNTDLYGMCLIFKQLSVTERNNLHTWLENLDGPRIPKLSVPFQLFVARDINLVAGTWTARTRPNVTPLVLSAIGTPSLQTDLPWASEIPVLNAGTGAFRATRTALSASAGFSVAFMGDMDTTGCGVYTGTPLFANGGNRVLRFTKFSNTQLRFQMGNASFGAGRTSEWIGDYPAGTLVQFDRATGTATLLSAASAYSEGVLQTITTAGTASTDSAGDTLIIGAFPDTTGTPIYSPNTRILAAFQNTDGNPLSSNDRARLTEFMQGIRSGTIL